MWGRGWGGSGWLSELKGSRFGYHRMSTRNNDVVYNHVQELANVQRRMYKFSLPDRYTACILSITPLLRALAD